MSKRKSSLEMFSLIREWESSNEKQQFFCQSRGISLSVFAYWRKKYIENKSIQDPHFTEILAEVSEKIEVCYPNGVRIKVVPSRDMIPTIEALIALV